VSYDTFSMALLAPGFSFLILRIVQYNGSAPAMEQRFESVAKRASLPSPCPQKTQGAGFLLS